jgi:hypothetical protein
MDCNSKPFDLGNSVLIEYPDRKTPKVVGFKKEPIPCFYCNITANFEYSQPDYFVLGINFTDTSEDIDSVITFFSWKYEDSDFELFNIKTNTTHIFPTFGDYDVYLIITCGEESFISSIRNATEPETLPNDIQEIVLTGVTGSFQDDEILQVNGTNVGHVLYFDDLNSRLYTEYTGVIPAGSAVSTTSGNGTSDTTAKERISVKKEQVTVKKQYMLLLMGDPEKRLSLSYSNEQRFNVGDYIYKNGVFSGEITGITGSTIFGDFSGTKTGDTVTSYDDTVSAFINDCGDEYYRNTYTIKSVLSGYLFENFIYKAYGAPDVEPLSDRVCFSSSRPVWSKTYNNLTVSAGEYWSLDYARPRWFITASYLGQPLGFGGGDLSYGPFTRWKLVGLDFRKCFIGFDVWEEYGSLMFSVCSDTDTRRITVFTVNTETLHANVTESYSGAFEYPEDEFVQTTYKNERTFLCGLDKRTAYYCRFGLDIIYTQIGADVTVSFPHGDTPGAIVSCCWNHITKTPHWVWNGSNDYYPGEKDAYYSGYCLGETFYQTLACKTYSNGAWIGDCEEMPFVGTLSYLEKYINPGLSVTLPYYAAQNTTNRFTNTQSRYYENTVTPEITDKGEFIVEGVSTIDKGEINYSTGTGLVFQNIRANGGLSTSNYSIPPTAMCFSKEAKDVLVGGFLFDASGGCAFSYSTNYYIQRTDRPEWCTDVDDWTSHEVGDADLLPLLSGFPYDDGWKAILLSGKDSAGGDIEPSVVYNGFLKTASGAKITSSEMSKYRCFFQPVLMPQE